MAAESPSYWRMCRMLLAHRKLRIWCAPTRQRPVLVVAVGRASAIADNADQGVQRWRACAGFPAGLNRGS